MATKRKRKRRKDLSPPEIYKIQRSMFTNAPSGDVTLVYNEDHSVLAELDTPREIKRLLRPDTKGYFYCEIKDGILEVGLRAEEQDW